jgi:hypothetical protein
MKTIRNRRYRAVVLLGLVISAIWGWGDLWAFDIFPEVVGNGESDSIMVTFETFDTTAIPVLANPDSLKILRFGSDGNVVDSLGEDDSRVVSVRVGSYEVHLRSSDSLSSMGRYRVRVYAYKGGQIRGAASGGYYVKAENWDGLDSARAEINAVLDTLQDGFASQTNQDKLDTTVSSRSTLTASDNIGINWMDISNATAFQYLPNSYWGGLLSEVVVDTAKIARSVWDDDIVAENSRSVDLSGCGAGSGAYPCSLYVFNQADSSAMQGVVVRIMNGSQTATAAVGVSDPDGLVVASLDAAEYCVWVYKAGVEFDDLPDTVAVSSPSVMDTIWGSCFDPGEPVAAELCRVYGWIFDLSGEGLQDVTVTAKIGKTPIRYQGTLISPYYRTVQTDSSGYWFMDLFPSESLTPDDSEYEFMVYYEPGRIARKKIKIPDLANWELGW